MDCEVQNLRKKQIKHPNNEYIERKKKDKKRSQVFPAGHQQIL